MSRRFFWAALVLALLLSLSWPLAAQPSSSCSSNVPLWLDDVDPVVEVVLWPSLWLPLGWPLLL